MAKEHSIVKKDKFVAGLENIQTQQKQYDQTGHVNYGYAAPSMLDRDNQKYANLPNQEQSKKNNILDRIQDSINSYVVDHTIKDKGLLPTSLVTTPNPKHDPRSDYEDARRKLWEYQISEEGQQSAQKDNAYRQAVQERSTGDQLPYKDETLDRLRKDVSDTKAAYESEKNRQHDQPIYEQDMSEISGLTPEELEELKTYVNVRSTDSGVTNPLSHLLNSARKKHAAGSLWDKYGEQRLEQLAETYTRDSTAKAAQNVQEYAQRASQGAIGGTAASLGSVLFSPVNTIAAAGGRLDEAAKSTHRYAALSPYTAGDMGNLFFDTAEQSVAQQIAGDNGSELGAIAAGLYQGVMGAGKSMFNAIVLGPTAGAAVSATGQFTRTLSEASQRGATAEQAYLLATSSGVIDYAMDKIPLDRLVSLAKSGSPSVIKSFFKQAGIEMTTEGASFVGSQLLDMAILQENSEYAQNIQAQVEQGVPLSEATRQANKDLLRQSEQQILVAGLSGGISGAVSTAIGKNQAKNAPQDTPDPTATNPDARPGTQPQPEPPAQPNTPPQDTTTRPQDTQPVEQTPAPESPQDTVSRIVSQATQENQAAKTAARRTVQDTAADLVSDNSETPRQQPIQPDTLGMQSEPSGDTQKSRTVTNSGLKNADQDIRSGYRETLRQDATAGDYQVKHNADSMETARVRTSSPERVRAEYDYLINKSDSWTAEDVATGRLVSKELFKSGDVDGVTAMNKQLAKVGTNAGQVAQAFAITGTMKDASDPLSASESATSRFLAMKQKETTYNKAKDGPSFEQWQNNIAQEYTRLAMDIENVPQGDTAAMREIIRQISQDRKNTAWLGLSSRLTKNAQRILNKLDFDTLKMIANTQIAAMPDDYRARSALDIAAGIRKQSMLSSLKTFGRNIGGNVSAGILDSTSDSTGGRFADFVMSKYTGKRTVANDFKLPDVYLKAARDATDFASLCVELNVPIETDAVGSFNAAVGANGRGKYIGKTFRSNGNFAMRLLYGYQKYMSYALEVSDKFFEGGTNASVTESLNRMKNSGLNDAEISELAEFTANRRTFKDATWQENGKTHGSNLSRVAQNLKNIGKGTDVEPYVNFVGDVAMPFASVPENVAQTGIDYTTGILKGATEIATILHDAKHGKQISVARQRQAASDFGRGVTGPAFLGLMTVAASKGILKVYNDPDKNKKAMDRDQGLSGALFNWDALSRSINGESEKWQSTDLVSSPDFLEPFNNMMYLAYELSQDDDFQAFLDDPSFGGLAKAGKSYAKSSFASAYSAFMDSPMVEGLNQIKDLGSTSYEAVQSRDMGEVKNALAEYGGNVASSFIPQFVRQAAQTKDGYYRDTRGENALEYAKNSLMNAIPGLSEKLPKKINGYGQEQKRGGAVANFLDPTNTHRLQLDDTAEALSELSEDPDVKNIYPERQSPLVVKNAVGDEVRLTAQQRETYQKVYGSHVKEYQSALVNSKEFDMLPNTMKAEALRTAKEYGADYARAAVTDFRDVPDVDKNSVVSNIVNHVLKGSTTSSMDDLDTAWKYGTDTKKATDSLDEAYTLIRKLPEKDQQAIVKDTNGAAKKYLEGRMDGIDQKQVLSVIKNIQSISEKNREKAHYQYQAISKTPGLSDAQMDKAMKLYMPDYDPEEKEPVKTEPRYDFIRQQLGFSPQAYAAAAYAMRSEEADTDGDGKIKKNEMIQAIMDLGYDRQTATWFWGIYSGSGGNAYKNALNRFISENY